MEIFLGYLVLIVISYIMARIACRIDSGKWKWTREDRYTTLSLCLLPGFIPVMVTLVCIILICKRISNLCKKLPKIDWKKEVWW